MYTLGETLLKLDSVSLSFGSNLILRDINLEVKDILADKVTGQVITLMGASGIGKTQLLKMIAGLQSPSSGEILIKGQRTEAGLVGLVDQRYPLFNHRTLISNLKLISRDKDKIEFYINEFDLSDHQDKYPAQLSGGQRQRAAIVQQLLCSEHFILLDEPFSGLDLKAISKLCKVILKLVGLEEQLTIIISSHILKPALALSDCAWMLGYDYTFRADAEEVVAPERAMDKVKIPGAVIVHQYDLAANGLAWRPDIETDTEFIEFVNNVEKTFKST